MSVRGRTHRLFGGGHLRRVAIAAMALFLVAVQGARASVAGSASAAIITGHDSAHAVTMRVGRTEGRTRMVFDLEQPTQYTISTRTNPDTILVELATTQPLRPPAAGLFLDTPVARLRPLQAPDGRLQVELELSDSRVRVEDFVLKPYAGAGHRLVVDLYQEPADAAIAAPAVASATNATGTQSVPPAPRRTAASHLHKPTPPRETAATSTPPAGAIGNLWTGGYAELGAAYTYAGTEHWSQLRARLELGASGDLGDHTRFRVVGRGEGDAAFHVEDNFYPDTVRRNQETDLTIREAYLDISAGDWEYRLGRQYVVWGEMVGLFLADVVSARDTREFFLPEFESMRIGQWAVRAERFAGDSHFELLWVPYVSYDEVGKPGADFYPYPLPPGTPVNEITPSRSKLSNTNYGARYSLLAGGWDLTAFYYQSNDVNPTLYTAGDELQLRHDRIDQFGTTFSKDYFDFVLKGEAVYTSGRGYPTFDALGLTGTRQSDAVDYIVGATIPRGDWRFDMQLYGRYLFDHDASMEFDASEVGLTLLANRRFGEAFEAELLYLGGLNRSDYSWQPSVTWHLTQTWRLQFGVDIFGGSEYGYFGRYEDEDRVFLLLRNWF